MKLGKLGRGVRIIIIDYFRQASVKLGKRGKS